MQDILFDVNLGIVVATVLLSLYAWQKPQIFYGWMLNPPAVDRGQYFRFVTSGFIHADYMHLFFNMFTLYNFGGYIEQLMQARFGPEVGRAAYLLFYIVAIIASDIPSYLKNRGNPNYNSLGASGAVSAVVFGAILFFPTAQLLVFFIPMPAFIYAFLYLAYTYYEMRRGLGYVNHSAHWWGSIFGVIVMVALYPDVVPHFISEVSNWRPF
ncbi:MAG: rhomboid family intramembrane serine protease [Spirosomataceae bacterium]